MNTINDLRNVLFDTLEALKNKEQPMDIDRALAMKEVAQVIVNSAKIEIDHMRISGGSGSGFIPEKSVDRSKALQLGESVTLNTQNGKKTITAVPGGTVTRHAMGS